MIACTFTLSQHPTPLQDSVRQQPSAFSRLDLLALLAAVGLLLLLTLPALAHSNARSERLLCLNNLRQIGQALHLWGYDHNNERPWRVPVAEGGTMQLNKIGNAWQEFSWLSNQLVTPRILVCPSDTETRRVASDFSTNPDSGLIHGNFRGNAISYFIGLDTFPLHPMVILAGDRNVTADPHPVNCSSGILNAATLTSLPFGPSYVQWTSAIHHDSGNILLDDGQVHQASTTGLQSATKPADDNGIFHILLPR